MIWPYVAASSVSAASVAFLLVSTPSGSGGDSPAAFSPKVIDLGELSQEEEYPVRLVLTNNGRDSLTVESLTTTCHCTGVTPIEQGTELGGGQSLNLLASFSTGSAEGPISSKIVAELKRKGRSIFTEAIVEGHVIPEYQITPRELELTLVEGNDFASGSFQLVRGRDPAVVITEAKCPDGLVRLEIAPDRTSVRVSVRAPNEESGIGPSFNDSIFLETTNGRIPRQVCTLRVRSQREIRIIPPKAVITMANGVLPEAKVVLLSHWGTSVKSALVSSPHILADVEPGIRKRHVVRFRLVPMEVLGEVTRHTERAGNNIARSRKRGLDRREICHGASINP